MRRHARQPTSQVAQVQFGEGTAIPSRIRDYCPTGLYLAFPGEFTPDAAIPALVGTPVRVTFAAAGGAVHGCDGRVAHILPGGVGIFVAAMSEGALAALRHANTRPAGRDPVAPGSPQQAEALKQACTGLLRGFLDAVVQDVFQQAGERLAEAGLDASSFLERSRYECGAEELAQCRQRITDEFFDAMRERIQAAGSRDQARDERSADMRLALVDEAEFEDWLNLSAVIAPIETDFAPQLHVFEQRYSRIAGRAVDRKTNPFGPDVIGRTFQGAIQSLDFSNPMRMVLYKVLGQAIARHGPALYHQLDDALAGLQPVVPPRTAEPAEPEEPAVAAESPARADLAEVAETLNRLYGHDRSATPPAAETVEYSFDRLLASLDPSARRAPERPDRSLAGGVAGRPAAERAVLPMVDRLQQLACRLRAPVAPLPTAAGAADDAQAPQAGVPVLLHVLDELPLASPVAAGLPPAALADRVAAGIAAAGAGQLAPAHRRILETTSGLFERAREDLVPSSDVEALVKRLERPLLKLALQDVSFPTSPDHPARQVLNLIEQYAVAADDHGRFFDAKLQRFLYLLVDRVCSRADDDPGIFEMVRDSLAKVLVPILQIRRRRVARLQEASEGRERIRMARVRVNAALEARLAGREVPAMVLRLLDAGWRQHLVLLEMREGAQGAAWDSALAVLDRLLAGVGVAEAQALLVTVERVLAAVNVDTALVTSFIDELAASLGPEPPAAPVRVPPGQLHAASRIEDTQRALAARLRVGEWWAFSLEGRRVPMQLIWTSQPAHGCVFANRSATQKLELTLAELSRKLQGGEAEPGRDLDLPLIDRSEQSLFDQTYQHLVNQAMREPLTGLLNRKGFMHQLKQLPMPEREERAHAVGIIEFDQFRMITNTCGAEAAEELARSLAEAVRTQVGPDAVLAAFRDDTLALLLPNCSRTEGCRALDRLLEGVKDFPFRHAGHSYSLGFNIGMAEYSPATLSPAEAIRRADSACITAKSLGRNRMQVYEQANAQLQSQESLMDWAGRLDAILAGGGLHLRCQQVRPLGTEGTLLPYYEILLGIDGEAGMEIQPMDFIPAVERLQRAHEVDIWVMRRAFEWIRANPVSFAALGGFAINLSATSLSSPEVIGFLHQALAPGDIPAGKITFEITETAAIATYGAAQDFIREIRRYGCKFSLDDFGSGFTSYAHLKNLRTDALKIDGSFVRDMLQNPMDHAMVKSMNDIGHSLGLRTVAEYVESPAILEALREIGVDYVQGYAVHKPCRIEELVAP